MEAWSQRTQLMTITASSATATILCTCEQTATYWSHAVGTARGAPTARAAPGALPTPAARPRHDESPRSQTGPRPPRRTSCTAPVQAATQSHPRTCDTAGACRHTRTARGPASGSHTRRGRRGTRRVKGPGTKARPPPPARQRRRHECAWRQARPQHHHLHCRSQNPNPALLGRESLCAVSLPVQVSLVGAVQEHVQAVDRGRRQLEDDSRARQEALRDLQSRLQVCCPGPGR
jgi:hypothetical protein